MAILIIFNFNLYLESLKEQALLEKKEKENNYQSSMYDAYQELFKSIIGERLIFYVLNILINSNACLWIVKNHIRKFTLSLGSNGKELYFILIICTIDIY